MATFFIDLLTGEPLLLSGTGGGSTTGGTIGAYTEFNTFSELPDPSTSDGEVYLVRDATGNYIFNRNESGLYRSDGVEWYKLNNIVPYFRSDNFSVYEATDSGGTTGVRIITSGITEGNFRDLTIQDGDGILAYLSDVDLKLDESIFDSYTALTKTYYGVDTEANILALDPSLHINELWYARDTDTEYQAYSVSTTGTDEWIGNTIEYDPVGDTFRLNTTADGQTQNLGQEIFINAHNQSLTGATRVNPKAFVAISAHEGLNDKFFDVKLALAGDIGIGSNYGINTTNAEPNGYFKLVTYGLVNNIDTSAWVLNTQLYISVTEKGGLTDIKPNADAFVVGVVVKSDAVDGIIFVDTIRQVNELRTTIPLNFTYQYFTGDIVSGVTGTTNYFLLPSEKGDTDSLTLSVGVDDNTRADLPNEFLSPIVTGTPIFYNEGIFDAQIEMSIDQGSENEKVYVEVYLANSGGTTIDSGISGQTTGFTYPVRPLYILESSLLNLPQNTINLIYLSGKLLEDVIIEIGQRTKAVISVEKIGILGGIKTFTGYFGNDFNSFIRTPFQPTLGELRDVNTDNAIDGEVVKYNAVSRIWTASFLEINEINNLQDTLNNLQNTANAIDTRFTGYTATTENTFGRFSINSVPTGLITGGTLSINPNNSTQYDIEKGKGVIIDAYTVPDNPQFKFIEWETITGITLTGVTERIASFVSISLDGNDNFIINESPITSSSQKRRKEIILGTLIHLQQTVIETAKSRPHISTDIGNQVYDLFYNKFRMSRVGSSEEIITPNGGNLLLDVAERTFFIPHYNVDSDRSRPNLVEFPAQTGVSLVYTDSQGGNLDFRNAVDPTKYNPDGSNSVIDITGDTNQATVQRVFQFPNGVVNVQYGQKVYDTIIEAIEEFLTEDLRENVDVEDASALIGSYAVTVGANDLSNRRDAVFFTISKEGEVIGGQNGQFFNQKKFIIVRQLGDFPEPDVNGDIFLRDDFTYKLNGIVNIDENRLVVGQNNLLFSDYAAANGIIGNRSDAFLYGRDTNFTINDLTLININPNGSVFDFASDGIGDTFITDKLFFSNTRVGAVRNYNVVLLQKNAMFSCLDGYIISGDTSERIPKVKLDGLLLDDPISGFTAFTIEDSTFSKINVESCYFILNSGTTALNIPANLSLDSGLLIGNEFIGDGTYITGGATKAEIPWTWANNTNIADSIKLGFIKTVDNTLVTTINNTTDYFLANIVNDSEFGERFNITTNRVTYVDRRPIQATIIYTGTISTPNNNQTVRVAVFKNATELIGEVKVRIDTSGIEYAFAYNDLVLLEQNDFLEIRLRNESQIRDLTLNNIQFRVQSPS